MRPDLKLQEPAVSTSNLTMDAQPAQHGDTKARQTHESHEWSTSNTDPLNDANSETTLLDNEGNPTENDQNGSAGHQWEGADDFTGLSWWKTPSVCYRL